MEAVSGNTCATVARLVLSRSKSMLSGQRYSAKRNKLKKVLKLFSVLVNHLRCMVESHGRNSIGAQHSNGKAWRGLAVNA